MNIKFFRRKKHFLDPDKFSSWSKIHLSWTTNNNA